MPQSKKPPTGVASKAYSVHQPNIFSREVELSRNTRGSLEIFGGGPQTPPLLFSRTRSAWKDALLCAEPITRGNVNCDQDTKENIRSIIAESSSSQNTLTTSGTENVAAEVPIDSAAIDVREDDVTKWLADADKSEDSPNNLRAFDKGFSYSGSQDLEINEEAGRLRMSDFSVAPDRSVRELEWDGVLRTKRETKFSGTSESSDEVVSQRAVQWGYGVVLKPSGSRGSGSAETERISRLSWTTGTSDASSVVGKSSRTTSERSSADSGFSSIIPGVSKNVKEALASFQLAFVVCDALNPEYPVLYASAGFFSMTGYTAKEVIGRNCRFLQGLYTDAKDIEMIRDALAKGKIFSGKLLNYKKDGTPFWNLLTISPIKDDEGRIIKYIGMQAEVSENGTTGTVMDKESISTNMFIDSSAGISEETLRTSGTLQRTMTVDYTPASRLSCSSSKESDAQTAATTRYSLSSSQQSFDAVWNSTSAQKSLSLAGVRAEVLALRPGTTSRGKVIQVAETSASDEGGYISGSKSGKRSSGIIRMFKKLNGRFSSSKRGPQGTGEEALNITDDITDDALDFDDEEPEFLTNAQERKQRRSGIDFNTSPVDTQQDSSGGVSKGFRNSLSSLVDEQLDSSKSGNCAKIYSYMGTQLSREQHCDFLSHEDSLHGDRRPAFGIGRRSAQYLGTQGEPSKREVDSVEKDRRHSIAIMPSSGARMNVDGKSQFCIIHPTVTETNNGRAI